MGKEGGGPETRGGKRRGGGRSGEAEGEAGAAGAAARPYSWLLLWVSRRCFGVRTVGGGEWKKSPHHFLGKGER